MFPGKTKTEEDEEDEDVGLSPKLEKIVAHEDQEIGPYQEETELVNLGTGSGTLSRRVLAFLRH